MFKIIPIVEGHGEVESIPIILRRLLVDNPEILVGRPVRVKRNLVIREGGLEKSIILALKRPLCSGIMIILDADDVCPFKESIKLLDRAKEIAAGRPLSVVFAKRELESWFIGSIESLRGTYGIPADACCTINPEDKRGAKEYLSGYMGNHNYSEVTDQPRLAASFDIELASSRCRSLTKFCTDLEKMIRQFNS